MSSFRFAILLMAALPACGQLFSFGVKAGVPMTTAISTGFAGNEIAGAYDRRYIVGPTAEIQLPFHLSFEVDALYRRNGLYYDFVGFALGTPSAIPPFNTRTTVNDWQIPFLGKYTRNLGPLGAFADAGIVYRHLSTNGAAYITPGDANSSGVAVGGGISLKLLVLKISPEIRYTHWFSKPFSGGFPLSVDSTTNQADFLLGITF